ncbi:MAG: AAA family ATPase [Polyangiaceae bacterium]|nr:AAA family ATPase [Polyangiaceae bacterium]
MQVRWVCSGCSRPWDPACRQCDSCGATYPVNVGIPARPTTAPKGPATRIKVETLEGVQDLVPVHCDAVLARALGGIVPGSLVLVWGLPGAGKSTLAAELAAQLAARFAGLCYWLDMEQLNGGLIKACFSRTGSPTDRLRVVRPEDRADPRSLPVTWRDAIAVIPRSPRVVVVVDSLQTWAEGHREQIALMQSLRTLRPSPRATGATVLVISHATKKGDAAGRNTNQHSGDANVTVDVSSITVTKCRWVPCPRTLPRASSGAHDEPVH